MLAVNCARWEHLLADPGCSGWERLVCGLVRETAGARSPGRIDGGTVVDLQGDCGLPKLKTDAPILIDAPQKFEDPGLCRDPFQIEVRRTPEAQLPHRRMILPTPISSIPSYLAAETGQRPCLHPLCARQAFRRANCGHSDARVSHAQNWPLARPNLQMS